MKTTSMTGFGQAALMLGNKSYRIEIKTLNSKGLDIQCRWGEAWSPLEGKPSKSFKRSSFEAKSPFSSTKTNPPTKG